MTRNIWIGLVVVIVLAAGGWRYFNQSSAPTTSEATQLPMEQTASHPYTIDNPVPIASVKVGDKMGDFTRDGFVIISIKPSTLQSANPRRDFTISFAGETIIKGAPVIDGFWGADSVSLAVEKAYNPQLPRFMFIENENTNVIVCISNPDAARQALSGKQGNVSVIVKNYVVRFESETAFCDGAEFVGLTE